jgi:hypothetical protein
MAAGMVRFAAYDVGMPHTRGRVNLGPTDRALWFIVGLPLPAMTALTALFLSTQESPDFLDR